MAESASFRFPRPLCVAWLAWTVGVLAVVALVWARVPVLWVPFALAVGIGAAALGYARPLLGMQLFCVALPLFDSVPAQAPTGWFPPIALAWHCYFAGWLLSRVCRTGTPSGQPTRGSWPPIAIVVATWSAITAISAVLSIARYARWWPFAGEPFYVFQVNALGETNVDAIRRAFSWIALFVLGPAVGWTSAELHRDARARTGTFAALAIGLCGAMCFGLWQSMGREALNNTPHFAALGQINATFLDPNALGSWLMLALPAVGALAWTESNAGRRCALAALGMLSLYILLESGSRTGVLGLAVGGALAVAVALARWIPRERRATASVVVAIVALAPVALLVFGDTALSRRVAATLGSDDGVLRSLLGDRIELWRPALRAFAEFPLSGLGFGTYLTDVSNILGIGPGESFYRDNAASFYLQWMAETGVAGAVAATAFVAMVVWRWIGLARRAEGEDRALVLATVGLPAMALLFVVGGHTNAAEVQCLFWLLVGMLFASGGGAAPRWCLPAIGIAIAVFALASAHAAATRLSPRAMYVRGKHFDMRGGFHSAEIDAEGDAAWWTKREAFMMLPRIEGELGADLYVGHPDAAERPVRVRAWADDALVADYVWSAPGAKRMTVAMDPARPATELRFEVDRTWVPAATLEGNADARELGVRVGEFGLVAP